MVLRVSVAPRGQRQQGVYGDGNRPFRRRTSYRFVGLLAGGSRPPQWPRTARANSSDVHRQAAEVVADLDALLSPSRPPRRHHADRLQPLPLGLGPAGPRGPAVAGRSAPPRGRARDRSSSAPGRPSRSPFQPLVDVLDDRPMQRLAGSPSAPARSRPRRAMISSAIAFWAPIASIVTMPPRTSIFFSSSGIAVISLDFSSQTCWPRARPYSPAQAVTTCRAPRLVLRVVAAAGRLAVDGDDRPVDARLGRGLVAEAGDPGVEGGLEGLGLEHHQDATEDVLAGDAVGQVEDAGEEFLLAAWPSGRWRWARRRRRGRPGRR